MCCHVQLDCMLDGGPPSVRLYSCLVRKYGMPTHETSLTLKNISTYVPLSLKWNVRMLASLVINFPVWINMVSRLFCIECSCTHLVASIIQSISLECLLTQCHNNYYGTSLNSVWCSPALMSCLQVLHTLLPGQLLDSTWCGSGYILSTPSLFWNVWNVLASTETTTPATYFCLLLLL